MTPSTHILTVACLRQQYTVGQCSNVENFRTPDLKGLVCEPHNIVNLCSLAGCQADATAVSNRWILTEPYV